MSDEPAEARKNLERGKLRDEIARLRSACHVFIEARKHGGYGMDDAERAIREALIQDALSPCPTCGSRERIDAGTACSHCGCDFPTEKNPENCANSDFFDRLAAAILAGSEHDAIRWHGEDSEGQWRWQDRDARDVAKMIEREIAPILRERDALLQQVLGGAKNCDETGCAGCLFGFRHRSREQPMGPFCETREKAEYLRTHHNTYRADELLPVTLRWKDEGTHSD